MKPLVSVVIPVYNREAYLKECVDSVLNQTYQNIEIILVNDGSTDDSLKILECYQDKYPNKINVISKENGGVASARNSGIKAINGEWVKMVDSDDVLYTTTIEEFMLLAKKNGMKKTIFYSNMDYIDVKGNTIKHKMLENHNNLDNKSMNCVLLDHILGGTGIWFIHKSAFEHVKFDESLIVCEDYDFLLKLCLLHGYRPYLIEKKLIKSRKHVDSLVKNNGHHIFRMNHVIRQNILQQLEESDRKYYKKELKEMQKKLPFKKKIMRTCPKVMTCVLGESTTDKFIDFYTRKIKKIY